jgi:superfamily II DNA or RNA helicase
VLKVTLRYDKGTIVIEGLTHLPFAALDPRTNVMRAQAIYYSDIIGYLENSGIDYQDHVFFSDSLAGTELPFPVANKMTTPTRTIASTSTVSSAVTTPTAAAATSATTIATDSIQLRDYQQKSLDNWKNAGYRGCVVLPTGSGKTIVGMKAIEMTADVAVGGNAAMPSCLIVVPTIDLMDQWTAMLSKHFARSKKVAKIGNLGGGTEDIQPITVSTYDSAYLRASFLGNKFRLVIFDEVHHLAAPGYRTIAEQMAAPFRLGLTATIEREDDLHRDLPRLVGDIVFRASPYELAKQKHLADYEIERRKVELLPEEHAAYKENMRKYHECLNRLGGYTGSANLEKIPKYVISLEKLIIISGRNPIAREALLARNKAMNIALNSKAKLEELKEILAGNRGVKTIIFTQYNNMVYEISNKFLIPFITHKTGKEERQDVLAGFRDGRYLAIVTSKVLDEGIDVPDAELGVIVSGTGSAREFIQRLGRLLRRPQAREGEMLEKKARLIEIVSLETREETITSTKRKRALKSIQQQRQREEEQSKETC